MNPQRKLSQSVFFLPSVAGEGETRTPPKAMAVKPLIVGIGGTQRPNSSSERALRIALAAAEAFGAQTALLSGADLALPLYDPSSQERGEAARRMIKAISESDGLIIASPGYHGSISGLLKNALDYAEDLRNSPRAYFDGRAVGCIVCAQGWQAAGTTLVALRAIVHALRGWPTPLGVTINSATVGFTDDGSCTDLGLLKQLGMVGRQVVEFALRQPDRPSGSL